MPQIRSCLLAAAAFLCAVAPRAAIADQLLWARKGTFGGMTTIAVGADGDLYCSEGARRSCIGPEKRLSRLRKDTETTSLEWQSLRICSFQSRPGCSGAHTCDPKAGSFSKAKFDN